VTERGPDYADQLSTSEQAVLDQLSARIGHKRRPGTGASLAAGLAAAVILLTVASVLAVVRGTQPPQPPQQQVGSGPIAASVLLNQLASASSRAAASAASSSSPSPSADGDGEGIPAELRLEISITKEHGSCDSTAIAVSTQLTFTPVWPAALLGRARLTMISTPTAALTTAGCASTPPVAATPKAYPIGDTQRYTKDIASGWTAMVSQTPAGVTLPPYVDPRALGGRTAIAQLPPVAARIAGVLNALSEVNKQDATAVDPAPLWWALWVEFMTSSFTTPAQRTAALAAAAQMAAESDQVVAVDAADLIGRSSVAIQVPYLLSGEAAMATLTFDPDTGNLSQRAVVSLVNQVARFAITVFDVTDSGPGAAWLRQLMDE
jgi:hypothetical protein